MKLNLLIIGMLAILTICTSSQWTFKLTDGPMQMCCIDAVRLRFPGDGMDRKEKSNYQIGIAQECFATPEEYGCKSEDKVEK